MFISLQVEESETHRSWNLTLLEMLYYVLSSQARAGSTVRFRRSSDPHVHW